MNAHHIISYAACGDQIRAPMERSILWKRAAQP
jgi:hypothetical protein